MRQKTIQSTIIHGIKEEFAKHDESVNNRVIYFEKEGFEIIGLFPSSIGEFNLFTTIVYQEKK